MREAILIIAARAGARMVFYKKVASRCSLVRKDVYPIRAIIQKTEMQL
jgi:hypothetical protein